MSALCTTRRALLGVMRATPLATFPLVPAAAAEADTTAWSRVLAAFRSAQDATNAYDRDHLTPVADAHTAVRDRWPVDYDFSRDQEAKAAVDATSDAYDVIQARYDEIVDAQYEALDDLMAEPAPDLTALAEKLTIFANEQCCAQISAQQISETLMADARRLTGLHAVQPPFDHAAWMTRWSEAGGGLAEIDGRLELLTPGHRTPGDPDALGSLLTQIDSYGDEGRTSVLRTWRARRKPISGSLAHG